MDFSLRHRVQTGSGTYPTSHPTDTGALKEKRLGLKQTTNLHAMSRLGMCVELHFYIAIRLQGGTLPLPNVRFETT